MVDYKDAWKKLWSAGKENGLCWEVKHYEEGSKWGINEGRISKLTITDGKTNTWLINYDRGLDIMPAQATPKARALYQKLLKRFN